MQEWDIDYKPPRRRRPRWEAVVDVAPEKRRPFNLDRWVWKQLRGKNTWLFKANVGALYAAWVVLVYGAVIAAAWSATVISMRLFK